MKTLLLVFAILLGAIYYGSAQSLVVPLEPQNKTAEAERSKMEMAARMRAEKQNSATQSSSERRLPQIPSNPHTQSIAGCGCDIPLDSTFSPVPFTGTGYSGCPGLPPYYRNDDSYTATPIALPFTFCFYGHQYNSVYVNNNGTVTFDTYIPAFTPVLFPLHYDSVMIAPFWSDVDTRDSIGSGIVYYKLTPTALIVKWDQVGYYLMHSNLRNSYQLILTNGNDPSVPYGNNVAFCYKDMQWTSGDASSGVNGLNGRPATVGANAGNGVDYLQFGLFDHTGIDYYGPYNNLTPSGVEWLNNKVFEFNTCNGGTNLQPAPSGIPTCDTVRLCPGDTLNLPVYFFSPELTQITTVDITTTSGLLGWTVFYNVAGSPDSISAQLIANAANAGTNVITFTAIDNGNPHDTTIVNLIIVIDPTNCPQSMPHAVFQSSDTVFCNESGECINFFDFSTGNPTSWTWLFFGAQPDTSSQENPTNICYYTPGSYPVTLIVSNTVGSDTLAVNPMIVMANPPNPPTILLSHDTLYSSHASHYQWYFNGIPIPGAIDSFYVYSSVGTYSVQISNGTGCNALSGGVVITSVKESGMPELTFSLHPNPAGDQFFISHRLLVNGKIEIYNVLGEKIYSMTTDANSETINCKSFPSGIYFIRLTDARGSYTEKFLKQ